MAAIEHAGARRCVQCRRVLADVRNVALLVQGRVETETQLCRLCLSNARDVLRPRVTAQPMSADDFEIRVGELPGSGTPSQWFYTVHWHGMILSQASGPRALVLTGLARWVRHFERDGSS